MVKGMTRRIVDIKDTGSRYFDRAVFFVKMDLPKETPEYTLTQEASKVIDLLCADLRMPGRNKHIFLSSIVKFLVSAAFGALIAIFIFVLGVFGKF